MKIEGKLKLILTKESGTSKSGKDWSKQSIVVEQSGTYPKIVAVELGGKALEYFEKNPISIGSLIDCEVNVESREYNGKFYTSVQAWKISTLQNNNVQKSNQTNEHIVESDDLPF